MMASGTAPKGMTVAVTSIVFLVLAAASVGIRLLARVGYLKNAGGDDIAIVIALVAAIALIISTCFQVKHGLGKHFVDVSSEQFSKILMELWCAILFYNIALTTIKISIILQYLRVFVGNRIRYACWGTIVLVCLYGAEAVLTAIFTCVPVNFFWGGTTSGHCINKQFLWFFNAAFNILTDLIIMLLPMPVLSSLRLPLKQKIGLMLVFGLGGFVCLMSVLRLHSLYIVSISKDITFDNPAPAIWSNIEVTTGIICACMPAMKPVISRFFPRLLSSNRSKPTIPSQGRSHTFRSTSHHTSAMRLEGVDHDHKTVTRVEVGKMSKSDRDVESNSFEMVDSRRDIFVTSSVTQDVEGKSEVGSEKDLIFQRN